MAFFDVSLKLGTDNIHHFEIDESGDLKHDESFDSFINVSLFSDRRANESEMQQPEKRRGWEGDEFLNLNDYLIGSKLWLLEQSRNTIENRNKAVQIVQDAFRLVCPSWILRKSRGVRNKNFAKRAGNNF